MANPAQAPPSHFKSALLVAPVMVVSPPGSSQAPCSQHTHHQATFQSPGMGPCHPGCPQRRRVTDGLTTPPCPHEVSVKVPFLSHTLSPFLNTSPSHPPTTNSPASKRPREAPGTSGRLAGYHRHAWEQRPGFGTHEGSSQSPSRRCEPESGAPLACPLTTTTPATLPKNYGQFCIDSPPGISARGEGMRGSDLQQLPAHLESRSQVWSEDRAGLQPLRIRELGVSPSKAWFRAPTGHTQGVSLSRTGTDLKVHTG